MVIADSFPVCAHRLIGMVAPGCVWALPSRIKTAAGPSGSEAGPRLIPGV
jgi:hypothetical protein